MVNFKLCLFLLFSSSVKQGRRKEVCFSISRGFQMVWEGKKNKNNNAGKKERG